MAVIAVLGGSYLQYNFIDVALKLGNQVIVLDGNAQCLASNDKRLIFINIDFSKVKEVKEICLAKKVDLIYSPSTEKGNLIAAQLSKDFHYNYNNENVVNKTLDKVEQRKLKNELQCMKMPNWAILDSFQDFSKVEMKFPIVIKINNLSGGRGVSMVNSAEDIENAKLNSEKYFNKNSSIIAEEFIEGKQLSVETISNHKEHFIYAITEEYVSPPPLFIERFHVMSPETHDKFEPLIKNAVFELLNLIGIEYGSCHIELKITSENEIYLIEIASRTGGLRDYLAKYAGYENYNELILDVHLNGKLDIELLRKPKNHSLVNILTKVEDLYTFIEGKDDNTLHRWYFNNKGPVSHPKSLMDAYGYAYFKSKSSLEKYKNRN